MKKWFWIFFFLHLFSLFAFLAFAICNSTFNEDLRREIYVCFDQQLGAVELECDNITTAALASVMVNKLTDCGISIIRYIDVKAV